VEEGNPLKVTTRLWKKAFERFAKSQEGSEHDKIDYGIHAYTTKERAEVEMCWDRYLTIVPVKVKGKHIMAFGLLGDVAFTRGEIDETLIKRETERVQQLARGSDATTGLNGSFWNLRLRSY
jgi:hypothetical protein